MKKTSKVLALFIWLSIFLLTPFQSALAAAGEIYDPLALYLTWQQDPTTTMTIQWITPKERQEDLIEYQPDKETSVIWQQAKGTHVNMPNGQPYLLHRVQLSQLEPATTYRFRAGSDGALFKFRTMPKTLEQPIKFVEGGDVYHDTIQMVNLTNRQAAKADPMFAVLGGDIAYASDVKGGLFPDDMNRWMEFLKSWKTTMVTPQGILIPIIPAIGNHETSGGFNKTPRQAVAFYTLFSMPGEQGYDVLDFGDYMSLFILDSGHTHPVDGSQTSWLRTALAQRLETPFKFAIYHVPAYPSVRGFDSSKSSIIRDNWCPLFEHFGINAAFEHHDHAYKRTHPLRKGKPHPNGVLYLGDGAWGVDKPRKPRTSRRAPYLAKSASTNNFFVVTIAKNGVNYVALDPSGSTIDSFSQERDAP